MKLTVIGGGGVRSIFLARSLAVKSAELGIKELVFMDNDAEKLRIYGGMALATAKRLAPSLKFRLTTDAVDAVSDADYIITTIRVGGDEMRVRDEKLALRHGVLGQETTGAAGLSFAMRSIPALIEYCELIKLHSKPSVKVFNFTNPAGVVSQALRDSGYDFTYGICDAPSGMLTQFAEFFGESSGNIEGECYGLNHLSYFKSIKLNGREILKDLLSSETVRKNTDLRYFGSDLLARLSAVPNEYLYYYYYREKAVENILNGGPTRGEIIAKVNKNMTLELSTLDPEKDFSECIRIFEKWYGYRESMYMANETGVKREKEFKFDLNSKDSGGYAGIALQFIELTQKGKKGNMTLCVPNNGAIGALKDDDVIEVTCSVEHGEAIPHKIGRIPELNMELIRRVKLYERLAAKAILTKKKSLVTDALTVHPLVNSYSIAKELTNEYIEHNNEYTGEWA